MRGQLKTAALINTQMIRIYMLICLLYHWLWPHFCTSCEIYLKGVLIRNVYCNCVYMLYINNSKL